MSNRGKVYFKENQAGHIAKETDGSFTLKYNNSLSPSISLTLPVRREPYISEELFPFFDGLIPEGWLLNLAQKNWKIPKNDRMTLLLTTCQDCIGAVSVKSIEDLPPKQIAPSLKSANDLPIKCQSDRCLICMQDLDLDLD